jgi:hypothetical protein
MKIMFEWFRRSTAANVPINGMLLLEEAVQIATRFDNIFIPSDGYTSLCGDRGKE